MSPQSIPFANVERGGQSGWVRVEMSQDANGAFLIRENGRQLPVKLHRRLISGVRKKLSESPDQVFVMMRKTASTVVGDRVMVVPRRPYKGPGFWGIAAVQFAALLVVAAAIWLIVLYPLNDALIKIFS